MIIRAFSNHCSLQVILAMNKGQMQVRTQMMTDIITMGTMLLTRTVRFRVAMEPSSRISSATPDSWLTVFLSTYLSILTSLKKYQPTRPPRVSHASLETPDKTGIKWTNNSPMRSPIHMEARMKANCRAMALTLLEVVFWVPMLFCSDSGRTPP